MPQTNSLIFSLRHRNISAFLSQILLPGCIRTPPDEFIDECSRIIGLGTGMPQIVNDESIIPSLESGGYQTMKTLWIMHLSAASSSVPAETILDGAMLPCSTLSRRLNLA